MATDQWTSWQEGSSSLPPLHALVLVRFDKRKGSTVVWQRVERDSVKIDSTFEYKSLPSGLHNVQQDLVYFTHDSHAGLSAFENAPASAAERNASFFALVLLVPLDGSRLGRIWLYAQQLQLLAVKLRTALIAPASEDSLEVPEIVRKELNEFWSQTHKTHQDLPSNPPQATPNDTPKPQASKRRPRALTESGGHAISKYHPAASIIPLLDAFGPLIFPLHRAALLRQSILLIQRPPLRAACDFVYLLSVLTNLPLSVAEDLPDVSGRLDPLFAVGTYDLTDLVEKTKSGRHNGGKAYIACTSDELLGTRSDVYDIKVEFPGATVGYSEDHTWPAISTYCDEAIKASQRDVRRYKALRRKLYRLVTDEADEQETVNENAALLIDASTEDSSAEWVVPDESTLVETLPWAAIAYDSFLWWASAGERSSELQEEDQHDGEMLRAAFTGNPETPMTLTSRFRMSTDDGSENSQAVEMSLVTYFQRITSAMVATLVNVVASADHLHEDDTRIIVQKADLTMMGLDGWSKDDRKFVQDLVQAYFEVEAEVQGATVECCGVRFL